MTLSAVQADIFLHHLEIQSKNPEKLSKFYANVMGMKINRISDQKFICDGPERRIIITLGINKTLSYAGMVCSCLLYTSPSPRDVRSSRMPSSA